MPSASAAAETWIHAPGDCRGPYEVIAPLARGGYGEVYSVRGRGGSRWAMKVVRLAEDGAAARKAAERAVMEAALLKRLDHVNVVRYRDAFVDVDGAVVIVTELLAGASLRAILMSAGGLDVERALRLGRQLADAAAAVHLAGAVHRDIKPENVFVIGSDVVKLLDFGLAKCAGFTLKTAGTIGSPRYVAPEQLGYQPNGGARPDPRWDVYAIGLVVFEMIARLHPFQVAEPHRQLGVAEVIDNHLAGRIPQLDAVVPGIPTSIVETVARAVAREPSRRTPTAAALSAELAAARFAWLASPVGGESAPGFSPITDELRRIGDVDHEPPPPSEDARTLERPRPVEPAPATERLSTPSAPARATDGPERMIPYVDREALRARSTSPWRKP